MASEQTVQGIAVGCGSGIIIVAQVLFIYFKFIGVIPWSWWWVLIPIWMPIAIVVLLLVVLAIIYTYYDYIK